MNYLYIYIYTLFFFFFFGGGVLSIAVVKDTPKTLIKL